MQETVFLNGKFLAAKEARLPVLNPGFLYGWGLFETMRSYKGNIVYFNEHLARIKDSCGLIKINFPYSLSVLKKYIGKTVEINAFKDARVRLTLWKSGDKTTDTLIVAQKYSPFPSKKYKEGFSCLVSDATINENYFFARFKTTNHLFYQLAYLEAKEKGLDEAVILNSGGYLAEGSRSSIFFAKNNQLFTPALECGCLGGITRKVIFDLTRKNRIKISEGKFTLSRLLSADEAFLTNSLMGLMPLTRVKNRKIGKGQTKLTGILMELYAKLLIDGT